MRWSRLVTLCLTVVLLTENRHVQAQRYKTIYQKIQEESKYATFNDLVRSNGLVKLNLHYEPLTVFVPENRAFEEYEDDLYGDLALYHMSFAVKTLKLLHSSDVLSSIHLANPPLFITKINEDVYVNNAKILRDHSNYVSKSRSGDMGQQQVLHMIDQVLDPMIKSPKFSPNAYDFLTSTENWSLGGSKTVTKFLQRAQEHQLLDLFKERKYHTFLIPLDTGIDPHKYKMIDEKIILGHVIPNHVLFTRPSENSLVTTTDEEDTHSLSFERIENKFFIKGISTETNEVEYSAEIIVPNIPVKNGVIHLISQPLGNFNKTLKPFPYLPISEKVSNDPELSIFYNMGVETDFNKRLERENVNMTYFVARDSAWKSIQKMGLRPSESAHDILARHLVISDSPYSMQQLASMTRLNNYTKMSLKSEAGALEIGVFKIDGSYYIEWKKSYVKVVRADYICSNGMVHILNAPLVTFKKTDENSPQTNRSTENFAEYLKNYLNIIRHIVL